MELTEARRICLAAASPPRPESTDIRDSLGRVLAEAAYADRDLPGEARSRLDGFAIRSVNTRGASLEHPKSLDLLPGCLAAGHSSSVSLPDGVSVRILTGAPIPLDADAVVPFEEVVDEGRRIHVSRAVGVHEGLSLPGEEIGKGETLLAQGRILTPTRLALLASIGLQRVKVFAKPRVALLASGDEVRELGEAINGPWTYCNNRYLLGWLTVLHGGLPLHGGVVPDDACAIADALSSTEAEITVTTGGVGRGLRDFVLEAWQRAGIAPSFTRVNMIPGKNSAMGVKDKQLFFALPGNPWGAQFVFEELVAPVLWQCQGLKLPGRPRIRARLGKAVKKREGFFTAFRGALRLDGPCPVFEPSSGKRASLFVDLRENMAYILCQPQLTQLAAGEEVDVFFHDCPTSAYPLLLDPVVC